MRAVFLRNNLLPIIFYEHKLIMHIAVTEYTAFSFTIKDFIEALFYCFENLPCCSNIQPVDKAQIDRLANINPIK